MGGVQGGDFCDGTGRTRAFVRVARRARVAVIVCCFPLLALGGRVGGREGAEAAVLPVGVLIAALGILQLANPRGVRDQLLELDDRATLKWHPRPTMIGSILLLCLGFGLIGLSVAAIRPRRMR